MLKSTGASHAQSPKDEIIAVLGRLGIDPPAASGALEARSPIDGRAIGRFNATEAGEAREAIGRAHAAFKSWREVPAPQRGELVRLLGEELRAAQGRRLAGWSRSRPARSSRKGLGEVQEMIDICDFAVGLSRQLYGLTIATERPEHRMMETWHPLGCRAASSRRSTSRSRSGRGMPRSRSSAATPSCGSRRRRRPLTALAIQALFQRAAERFGDVPEGLSRCLIGGRSSRRGRWSMIRACRWYRRPDRRAWAAPSAPRLAARLARAILELGGNNAAIVAPSADLDLALRAIAFAAMGTAGQRCTTLRRLFVHGQHLRTAHAAADRAPIGSVRSAIRARTGTLVGPLIDGAAYRRMQRALDEARSLGGA